MCPAPQAFSTHWEAGTVLDLCCYHQVSAPHFNFMAWACLRSVAHKEEWDCRMPVFTVEICDGFVCLGSEKLVFPPCKNKLNMKTSDSIHALFISTACERNGEKKNPVFVK